MSARSLASRENNLDLLRLLAAGQVVYFHYREYFHVDLSGPAEEVLRFFPGVPIFFVISGFLISGSYLRSPSLRAYAANRALRIFPALWVSFVATLVMLAALHALTREFVTSATFPGWVIAQLSVAQFYNPPQLRGFGIGVVNGSLWTIPVELAFYITLPILFRIVRTDNQRRRNTIWIALAVVSFVAWYLATIAELTHDALPLKMFRVTLVPHLHMFLVGVIVGENQRRIAPILEGKLAVWFAIYVALMGAQWFVFGGTFSREHVLPDLLFTLVNRCVLACFVFAFAWTARSTSRRLLRGNDVSYGLYIYHVPVMNTFVALGLVGRGHYFAEAAAISIALAVASWVLVEKPALRLKPSKRGAGAPPRSATGAAPPTEPAASSSHPGRP